MSNSSLVSCTMPSPNHSGKRTHKIDRITPHCVDGQATAEGIGNCFASPSREASCNYGIGRDGRICLIVDEANRSWCSSSGSNDQRAITIECASDNYHPYAMNSTVYSTLIKLCVDICKRNGITKLLWLGSKEATLNYTPKSGEAVLSAHRWFANKACPGDWLYSRFGELAKKVTEQLVGNGGGAAPSNPAPQEPTSNTLYRVQTGAFKNKSGATELMAKVKAAGFDAFVVNVDGLYKVQVGAYSKKDNATKQAKKLKQAGFECFVVTASGSTDAGTIKVGSMVKVRAGARTYTGGSVAEFVYCRTYRVDELSGDRAVLDKTGICTPFNIKDLTLA